MDWDPDFLARSPMFEPLRAQAAAFGAEWPGLDDLQRLLDARITTYLADPGNLQATRELAVVPVLGVPGWCADNESESYYDDPDYFRPGRCAAGDAKGVSSE